MKFGLSQKKEKILKDYFKKRKEIEKVFIYGSRSKGNYSKGSDIDLAIKFKENQSGNIPRLKGEIEDLPILNEIGIIDEDKIEEGDFKKEYQKTKQLFYSRNVFCKIFPLVGSMLLH